jgi:Xaa-Pro aminopeptidase
VSDRRPEGELGPPDPNPGVLRRAVEAEGVAGAVHAGTGADPDVRYLTGVGDPGREVAVAVTAEGAALFADGTVDARRGGHVGEQFPGAVHPVDERTAPERAAAEWLVTERDGGTVLTPRHVPHDAALYVEGAGFELASTAAVREARRTKSPAEIEAVARTARAASHAMDRVREILAGATTTEGPLHWQGSPLSAERLRRQADAALASHGVSAAENTRVETGVAPAESGSVLLRPDEPIAVSLAPRGPTGYHAALACTLVVDGSGGWERRAHVACESARRVAMDEATPGTAAATVGEELRAELGAYGFDPSDENGVSSVGGGVGLARREPPRLDADAELTTGMVLRLAPRLVHDSGTVVALADTVVVGEESTECLTTGSTGMAPEA